MTAYSIAEASVVDTNVKGLKPWGIPFPWEDTNGNDLFDPGETVHKDCPEGVPDPSRYFCPGTRVILKIGTPKNSPKNPSGLPSLQQEPGHFFALDSTAPAAPSTGTRSRERAPTRSASGIPSPGDRGTWWVPRVQGTKNADLDADPNSQWNEAAGLPESDRFHADDGSWMNSPRVIRIPVYDPEVALRQREDGAWWSPGSRGSGSRASSTTRGPSSDAISRCRRSGRPAPRRARRPAPSSRSLRLVE